MALPTPVGNPCVPSPCGPNSQCQVKGDTPSCSCLPEFIGSPPNCKPECITNSECPYNKACINMKCKDPCPGACGQNAICQVVSHVPRCSCLSGYNGDPFIQCYIQQGKNNECLIIEHSNYLFKANIYNNFNYIADPVPIEYLSPCEPSPCGTNAICKEQNGAGSCSCLPGFEGNPYDGCRYECSLNTDCASNKACIRNKCQNPCPGSCGANAECLVINHLPMCTCYNGYTGDPFKYCTMIPPQSKILIIIIFIIYIFFTLVLNYIFFYFSNSIRTQHPLYPITVWTK